MRDDYMDTSPDHVHRYRGRVTSQQIKQELARAERPAGAPRRLPAGVCTGNCYQGRLCDCRPTPEPYRGWLTRPVVFGITAVWAGVLIGGSVLLARWVGWL